MHALPCSWVALFCLWAISPGPSPSSLRSFPLDLVNLFLKPRSLFPGSGRRACLVAFSSYSLFLLIGGFVGRSCLFCDILLVAPSTKTLLFCLLSCTLWGFGLYATRRRHLLLVCVFLPSFLPSHILCPPSRRLALSYSLRPFPSSFLFLFLLLFLFPARPPPPLFPILFDF